ncbi:CLIP domain-containing serine protease [Sergentomyia squamirostris]
MCDRVRVKSWHICVLFVLLNLPHIRSETECDIPNQKATGVCRSSVQCQVYTKLLEQRPLHGDTINFLRQLQCDEENSICCTHQGDYVDPSIENDPSTRKVRPHFEEEVANRFGPEDELPTLKQCGNSLGNRIIGGKIAGIDDFPWTALLLYESGTSSKRSIGCGGALISRNYVLTAAHCILESGDSTKGSLVAVRLGEYNTETTEDCIQEADGLDCAEPSEDIEVMKMMAHTNYTWSRSDKVHDIGLLKLARSTKFTDFIQPICLPMNGINPGIVNGQKLSVAGWGQTDMFRDERGFQVSPVKLKISLPIIDILQCSLAYRPYGFLPGPGHVCAGGRKSEDTCPGDSGSPLMHFSREKGKWVASGVVSFGLNGCGADGIPGIYTRVDAYIPWILSMMETN